MLILPEQKVVFISIPKTAGTSMHYALNTVDYKHPEPLYYHMGIGQASVLYPQIRQYKSFAFVRNPWDRLVSLYHDFKFNRQNQYSEQITVNPALLSEYNTFEEFCFELPESAYFADIHFLPQSHFTHVNNIRRVTEIGKFENINEDFDKIVERFNLKLAMPLRHSNKSDHINYRSYYTSVSLIDTVAELYKDDVEHFNYDF